MAGKLSDSAFLYTVCDGMGGARAGQTASSVACAVYHSTLFATLSSMIASNPLSADICKQLMEEAIRKANDEVFALAKQDDTLEGMGTTLVSALIVNKTVYIANVGDSRAYCYKRKKLSQITKDHSYVQYLLDNKMITEEEAENHPHKNWITRSVGTSADIAPDIYTLDLKKADVLLLCSDGLTNMVSDTDITKEITSVLGNSGTAFEDLAPRLITIANENGETDNITVIAEHTRK
jgi:protein phosphatase